MNILYLCDRRTYLTKMSRVRFHGINALSKIANVHYSGIGWDDYNNHLTVQENIDNMNEKFDICIVYKPLGFKNFKDINIPKCIRYNEMWDEGWTLKEIKDSGSQLVICHHLNNCEQYKKMNISGVKFVYVGHCAEKTVFKSCNLEQEYDILIAGALHDMHYPLRKRYCSVLPYLSNKYIVHYHSHPGYTLTDAYTNCYSEEYAMKINRSKIVLACCSKWGYRLGKYIEIPMCGTSVCGDLPDDNADDYSYVIEVTNDMSDVEIINKISYYLDNESERLEKVRKGIEFASNYTQEHYANRLLKEIKEYLN